MLEGKITPGLGEGKKFLELPEYSSQIKEKLGFEAFHGTLNLELAPVALAQALAGKKAVLLEGFERQGKRFFGVRCYPCTVNGFSPAVLILPEKTRHPPGIAEIIAPVHLRKKLGLKQKTSVRIELL